MGMASIASAFLEPDDAIEWTGERVAGVRHALSSWAPPST
jgi:hypothetical protein